MKIAVVSRDKVQIEDIKKKLAEYGLLFSMKAPNLVFCLGGDGTFLFAERKFPQVPKVLIRSDDKCKECRYNISLLDKIIKRIKDRDYKIKEYIKLSCSKNLIATNDFVVRNKFPTCCLRFQVFVNGKQVDNTLIGDGIVIATPFGSSAYYHSITKRNFNRGIGIAFNNPTKPMKPIVVNDGARIKLRIVREKATLSADNNPRVLELKENDVVEFRKAREKTRLVYFD